MAYSILGKLVGSVFTGTLRTAGGLASGAIEGATRGTVRMGAAGISGNVARRTAAGITGVGRAAIEGGIPATKAAAPYAWGGAKFAGHATAHGASVVGGAGYKAGRTAFMAATRPDTAGRNIGNLFTGREVKPALQLGIEGVAVGGAGLGIAAGAGKSRSLGAVSGYQMPSAPSLGYDGAVPQRVPSNMGDMGGTGDLVTALHTNRHG